MSNHLYFYADTGLRPLVGAVAYDYYASSKDTQRLHIQFIAGNAAWTNARRSELLKAIEDSGRLVREDTSINVQSGLVVAMSITLSATGYTIAHYRKALMAVWPGASEQWLPLGKRG